MKVMYPGMPFSPATALAQTIGAADTTITVEDGSVLPDAPNFATLGSDAAGETVSYAAKAGNVLSGCVRAVEGTAQQWNAGTAVSRCWNNIDYQRLIDNLQELDTGKAGKPETFTNGHLAAFDETGSLSDSGLSAAALVDDTLTESGKAADAAAVGEALNEKLPLSGGTLTGALNVPAPTAQTHAANRQYVDETAAAVLPQVTASDAGKLLMVSETGVWTAGSIPDAAQTRF